MSTASRPLRALPGPIRHLLYAVLAFAIFLGTSAILNPDKSLAQAREESERATLAKRTQRAPGQGVDSAGTIAEAERIRVKIKTNRPLLGTLTGSPYYIWVYAGGTGPVYTVADRAGRVLAFELTADELYEQLPEASVKDLQLLPAEGKLMMFADPDSQQILPDR
jgi:hypothetical protein